MSLKQYIPSLFTMLWLLSIQCSFLLKLFLGPLAREVVNMRLVTHQILQILTYINLYTVFLNQNLTQLQEKASPKSWHYALLLQIRLIFYYEIKEKITLDNWDFFSQEQYNYLHRFECANPDIAISVRCAWDSYYFGGSTVHASNNYKRLFVWICEPKFVCADLSLTQFRLLNRRKLNYSTQ